MSAQTHHAEALTIYDAQEGRVRTVAYYGFDIGVATHIWLARERCYRGFPDQALQHSQTALALAQEIAHPYILSFALGLYGRGLSVSPGGVGGARSGRRCDDLGDRAWIYLVVGLWDGVPRQGPRHAGTGRTGHCRDVSRDR